jgi:hypothetical protein
MREPSRKSRVNMLPLIKARSTVAAVILTPLGSSGQRSTERPITLTGPALARSFAPDASEALAQELFAF